MTSKYNSDKNKFGSFQFLKKNIFIYYFGGGILKRMEVWKKASCQILFIRVLMETNSV